MKATGLMALPNSVECNTLEIEIHKHLVQAGYGERGVIYRSLGACPFRQLICTPPHVERLHVDLQDYFLPVL